jgi:hypothetical protein
VSCLSGWTPSDGTIVVQSNTSSGNPLYDRGFVEQVETVVDGQTVACSDLEFPDGTSFAWVGDTAWAAPPREKKGQTAKWDAFLADRKSKGFTAVQIAPAVAWKPKPTDTWLALPDAEGFSFKRKGTCSDETIPNKSCWQVRGPYWQSFKEMVRKANDAGLLVAVVGVMNPVGIDIAKEYPNTDSAVKFANYLKGLLGGQCVIFSPAFDDDPGDIDPKTLQPRTVLMNAVGNALKGLTPSGKMRPVTNHLAGGKSNCDEYFAFTQSGWMTHYFFQSGHGGDGDTTGPCHPSTGNTDVQNAMMRARVMPFTLSAYTPALPAINVEGPYDATDYDDHPTVDTRYHIRQAAYLSVLSNAVGYSYGADGLALWDKPGGTFPGEPSSYFSLPSALDMGVLSTNLRGRHLVSHPEWIVSGTNPTDEKYKMVLASDEVSFVMAYLPGGEGGKEGSSDIIEIDSTKLPCQVCPSNSSAPWSFSWGNPASGAFRFDGSCSGSAGGQLTFTRPVCSRGSTECDWLLKIEKTGACPTAVGTPANSEAGIQAWTDTSAADGTSAVYAEISEAGGSDEPILLSPAGKAFQVDPRVSRVGSHHLVVWQADGLDGSLYGVYGALVGPRGEVSGPFKINHYTEHDQREPAVAGGVGGEGLVVWSSYREDGDRGGIFGRLVRVRNRGGDPSQDNLGEEFQISEEWAGHQQRPQVVADAGGYWVAWETLDEQNQGRSLSVRRLGLNGHPSFPEVRLPVEVGEQRKLLTLDRPTPHSVVLRWWRQDARGDLREVLEQEVGPLGLLGPVASGKG